MSKNKYRFAGKFKFFKTNEEKIKEEEHEEGVLKYRCEYLNGKKHGIVYCLKEDGSIIENIYENGKLKK